MNVATEIPSAIKNGITFWPIPEFDNPSAVFGADGSRYFSRRDLPKVPREYENVINDLFFSGGELPKLCKGVDKAKAARAIRALLSSFEPSHEAKVATAAYALWVWSTPEVIK